MSSKRPIIYRWEYGKMFGATVIRGYLADGSSVTRQVLWESHGQIGVEHQEITKVTSGSSAPRKRKRRTPALTRRGP